MTKLRWTVLALLLTVLYDPDDTGGQIKAQQLPIQQSIVILGGGGTVPSFFVPPPPAPVVTPSTSSGTLAAGQYSVRTAFVVTAGSTPTLPSVPTAVTLTAAGNLLVTSPTCPAGVANYNVYMGTSTGSETQQGSSTACGTNFTQSSSLGAGAALPAFTVVPNGAASAGNLTATINSFSLLAEKGPRWSVNSVPAVSVLASASQAAGGAGVRNVADCITFSAGSTSAPAATQLTVNLRDGASGAGTVKMSWTVIVLAATGQNVPPFAFCGLNIVGSANTAMTLEFSSLLTNLFENVALSGYQVQ